MGRETPNGDSINFKIARFYMVRIQYSRCMGFRYIHIFDYLKYGLSVLHYIFTIFYSLSFTLYFHNILQ